MAGRGGICLRYAKKERSGPEKVSALGRDFTMKNLACQRIELVRPGTETYNIGKICQKYPGIKLTESNVVLCDFGPARKKSAYSKHHANLHNFYAVRSSCEYPISLSLV